MKLKYHDCIQNSPEWRQLRKGKFTGSELGPFVLQPRAIALTVPEICEELTKLGIDHKKNARRDDLIALLPDPKKFEAITSAAQTLIDIKLGEPADEDDCPPPPPDTFWTARGKRLEPVALDAYRAKTGLDPQPIGFVEVVSLPIGCSPDSVFFNKAGRIDAGLEMKCLSGKVHIEYLRNGVLPDEYRWQVEGCMAITGADWWDFWSWHPNLPPLYVRTHRSETTDKVLAGLLVMAAELRSQEKQLAALWRAEFEGRAA